MSRLCLSDAAGLNPTSDSLEALLSHCYRSRARCAGVRVLWCASSILVLPVNNAFTYAKSIRVHAAGRCDALAWPDDMVAQDRSLIGSPELNRASRASARVAVRPAVSWTLFAVEPEEPAMAAWPPIAQMSGVGR